MHLYCDHEGLTINLDLVEEFGKKENEIDAEKKFTLYFIFPGNGQDRSLHYPTERSRSDDFDKIMDGLSTGQNIIEL